MRQKYAEKIVFRSPMIVAGHNDKYIKKAFASQCDAIVLDLEDGVPDNFKSDARAKIFNTLNSAIIDHRPLFVRINSLESGLMQLDIDGVCCANLDGVVSTKSYSSRDIKDLDSMLSKKEEELCLDDNHFKIIVIIETPSSIMDLKDIAISSKRVVSLLFGAEDLLSDMEGTHLLDDLSLLYARSQVLMACRAYNLIPIDAPYIQIDDDRNKLKKYCESSFGFGYEGMLLVSPSQIEIVNHAYTPQKDEIEDAYRMIQISEENKKIGAGVSVSKRLFISPPTLKRAIKLIERYEAISSYEKHIRTYIHE